MVKATANGITLAESNDTITVEGNHYFPPSALVEKDTLYAASSTHTVCPWKGTASYYDVKLPDGRVIRDAAWYYPDCFEKAKHIEGYIAFYKNKVTIAE